MPAPRTILPVSGKAAVGRRMLVHVGPARRIGTIGFLFEEGAECYALTAGHVVADVYRPGARYPAHILPDSPLGIDGLHSDIAAIPLSPDASREMPHAFRIAREAELTALIGADAHILVERCAVPARLPVVIERIDGPTAARFRDRSGIRREVTMAPSIIARFTGGPSTRRGDSGAALIVERDGVSLILGFHFVEFTEPPDRRSRSRAVAAWCAMERINACTAAS